MLNALIFNCLLEQLQTTDKAIVPELGTFSVTTVSASLNYVTNRFEPPHKIVTFSLQYDKDDESLVNLLASRQHVTEDEARTFLHDFAESVKQMLQTEGKIDLDDLGTLVKNDEGIVLEEKPSVRLFNDDIGYDAFTATLLKRKTEQPAPETTEEPQKSETQSKAEETPIDISIADDDVSVEHHYSIFKPLLLVLCVAAILFGVSWYMVKSYPEIAKQIPFFYLSPNEYLASQDVELVTSHSAPQPLQPVPEEPYIDELSILDDFLSIDSLVASIDTTEIVDTLEIIDTTENIKIDIQATHSLTVPDTVVTITPEPEEMPQMEEYYIVVASSRDREEVERKSKKFIKQGFPDTQIVYNEERRSYRVVVESYNHAATANQRLREIRKTVCAEAWIFHQEKK